jgi:hypothetical protein
MSYAAAGWPVLPLKVRDKVPATKHGLHDATDDPEQVERWWTINPNYNIGLRTGIAFDVLDLDGPAAIASLNAIVPGYRHAGPFSMTGKGYHLLFAPTGSRNGAALRPGIDWRGDGGYIVAPPSIHPSGSIYTWDTARGPNTPLPAAPDWLVKLLSFREEKKPTEPTKPVMTALGMLSLREEVEHLGTELRRVGSRYVGRCPFGTHSDTSPSFNIYPNETFYCFGCGAWGDALNIVNFARTGELR